MARFLFTARDRSQATIKDHIEAPSRKEAVRRLQSRRLTVLSLDEVAGGAAPKSPKGTSPAPKEALPAFSRRRGAPGPAHTLPFLQSLSDLTASGLSAGESVRLLATRIQEPGLKSLCSSLWESLSEGATLSRAMAAHPAVFDESTINLIQAGEATGSLREVLGRLIHHRTEAQELRNQVLSALAYPVFVMLVAGCVILFFLFFLLPRLQALFSALGGKLPLSTQILIATSDFALHYGLFVLGAAVFAGLSFWRWAKTPVGKAALDAALLRLPLVGPFIVSRTALTFAQTLSVLLENGITTSESLRMTERQLTNSVHRAAFSDAVGRVLEGESISSALQRTAIFPPLMLDQLAIGENTGNLVPSLKIIGTTYQKHLTRQLHLFTRVLSSAVLLGVFAFVGFLAFAIVSAVFNLSASFKF